MGYKVGSPVQAACVLLSPLFRAGVRDFFLCGGARFSFMLMPVVLALNGRTLPTAMPSKAKQGYCIYRVRVKRGDRKKRVAKA